MQFTRATDEPDYALLTATMNKTPPYFFAAHNHNYTWYGLFCFRSLTYLPNEVVQQFLRGKHILHHTDGLWNGIPSDQFIETVGWSAEKVQVVLPEQHKTHKQWETWSHNQHAVVTLMMDLQMMNEEETLPKISTRGQIKIFLVPAPYTVWIHWSNASWQSPWWCLNQYSCWCHRSHKCQHQWFSHFWPGATWNIWLFIAWSFCNSIKQQTITFSDTKKAVKVGDTAIIDQKVIYARVIGLIVSQWELDLSDVLSCELAAYPPSMFNPDGSIWIATNKAWLKKSLAIETSVRVWGQPSFIVVDVSAVLWT